MYLMLPFWYLSYIKVQEVSSPDTRFKKSADRESADQWTAQRTADNLSEALKVPAPTRPLNELRVRCTWTNH